MCFNSISNTKRKLDSTQKCYELLALHDDHGIIWQFNLLVMVQVWLDQVAISHSHCTSFAHCTKLSVCCSLLFMERHTNGRNDHPFLVFIISFISYDCLIFQAVCHKMQSWPNEIFKFDVDIQQNLNHNFGFKRIYLAQWTTCDASKRNWINHPVGNENEQWHLRRHFVLKVKLGKHFKLISIFVVECVDGITCWLYLHFECEEIVL